GDGLVAATGRCTRLHHSGETESGLQRIGLARTRRLTAGATLPTATLALAAAIFEAGAIAIRFTTITPFRIRCRQFLFQPALRHQRADFVLFELIPTAALERRRQREAAIAGANQPGNGQADRLEHASHFTVAPLADDDPVPA